MRELGIVGNWALGGLTPADLAKATDDLIARLQADYDKVGVVNKEDVNNDNCIKVTSLIRVKLRHIYIVVSGVDGD